MFLSQTLSTSSSFSRCLFCSLLFFSPPPFCRYAPSFGMTFCSQCQVSCLGSYACRMLGFSWLGVLEVLLGPLGFSESCEGVPHQLWVAGDHFGVDPGRYQTRESLEAFPCCPRSPLQGAGYFRLNFVGVSIAGSCLRCARSASCAVLCLWLRKPGEACCFPGPLTGGPRRLFLGLGEATPGTL